MRVGDTWKGRDLFLWMHREIQVPAEWKGKKIVGVFDFGNTGAGNNAGFESMLYLNGKMYQAWMPITKKYFSMIHFAVQIWM